MAPRAARRLVLPFVLAVALAGCGLGSFQDTVTGVDSGGGRLVAADGRVVVEVPPGAVADDSGLLVEPVPAEVGPRDDGVGGGYRVGPDTLALEAPIRVTHTAAAPDPAEDVPARAGLPVDVLVTEGTDGEPLLVEDQEVRRGRDGGTTTSGRVAEPGTVRVVEGQIAASVSPAHVVVPVGSGFTAQIDVRAVDDAPAWIGELVRELQTALSGSASGAAAVASAGGVETLPAGVRVTAGFACERPGRGRFGAGGAGMRWLLGVVDCQAAEDVERVVGLLPEEERDPEDELVDELLEGGTVIEVGDGDAAPSGTTLTISALPAISAKVGQVVAVSVQGTLSGLPQDRYLSVDVDALAGRGGLLQPLFASSFFIAGSGKAVSPSSVLMFRCKAAGQDSYGVRMASSGVQRFDADAFRYVVEGAPISQERTDGTATCEAGPAGTGIALAKQGGQGEEYRLVPDRLVARVGERMQVRASARVVTPADSAHQITFVPRVGSGDALAPPPPKTGPYNFWFLKGAATQDSDWSLQCVKEGSQAYGMDVTVEPYTNAEHYTAFGLKAGTLSFTRNVMTGSATCLPALRDGDRRVGLVLPGGFSPGHALVGGYDVAVTPGTTALVGADALVQGVVRGGDVRDGEVAYAVVIPRSGSGEALAGPADGPSAVALTGPAGGAFDVALPCVAPGVEAPRLTVRVLPERYDGAGRLVREAEAVAETVHTSVVRCVEEQAEVVPAAFGLGGVAGVDDAGSLPASLEGPCDGRATVDGGVTVDPSASGGVYTVPRRGSASYHGAIEAVAGEPRVHNGQVVVSLPAGLSVPVATWEGETDEVSRSGSWSWDLAGWVPGGAVVPVSGAHVDTAGVCTATVMVRFDGGFTESPVGPAAAALALLSLGGLVWAAVPKP